jgi:hypothetical protein
VSLKSGVQDGLALDQQMGFSQMNHGGGHQPQAGVVMLVVDALEGTSTSEELVPKGTAILASLTMFLLAARLCYYRRGKCLIDIGTEGSLGSSIGEIVGVSSR